MIGGESKRLTACHLAPPTCPRVLLRFLVGDSQAGQALGLRHVIEPSPERIASARPETDRGSVGDAFPLVDPGISLRPATGA
jgi:hypothetical protein